MTKTIDLTGLTFGRLTVVSRSEVCADGSLRWQCACACGSVKSIRSRDLRNGAAQSCGCRRRELARDPAAPIGKLRLKHGHAANGNRTPEYDAWVDLKQRCLNPRNKRYAAYGGRGITVDPRWINSFDAFLADVGPRPGPGMSIDRIDNDRGYSAANCRWATAYQQVHNRRTSAGD